MDDISKKFIHSSRSDRLEIVKEFLDSGAVDVNVQDISGWTALMSASEYGHLEVVKELLRRGANVNAQSDFGFTPLILASENNFIDVVKELLKQGADPGIYLKK